MYAHMHAAACIRDRRMLTFMPASRLVCAAYCILVAELLHFETFWDNMIPFRTESVRTLFLCL